MMRVMSVALAAMLLGVAPAAAWSPPRRVPEAKARPCPEMGEGYVRVPGSSTCIKLSGLVRVEGLGIGGSR